MKTIKKIRKITSENGYVTVNNRVIAFFAKDIPENAVVDSVVVDGEHLCNMFDVAVDDKVPEVAYPLNKKDCNGDNIVAVVFVRDGSLENILLQHASIGDITEFDVIYHEEYIVEA